MSSIKVRVGQANAIKVLSSQAGGTLLAEQARNVIGGIASVTQLHVSGISTFVGIITAKSDVFFDGNLTVGGDINLDEITARNLDVTGIGTIASLGVSGVTTSQHLNVTGVSTLGTVSSLFVSGLSTFSNNVSFASSALFGDNDKLLFGDGNDLELYHNGTASYIDNNTGPLFIRNNVDNDDGGNIIIQAKSGKTSAVFQDDEGVRLYYNDVEKFITTDDGIIISGIASATSFQGANATAASFPLGLTATNGTFSGNVSIGGTLTYEDVTNVDSVGLVTARTGVRILNGGLVVNAGISTFGAIATFSNNAFFDSDIFVDGTLTAGLIDGGVF